MKKHRCTSFISFNMKYETGVPEHPEARTRVAAEGHFARGGVGLFDSEIPVLVDAQCGRVGVPAGVSQQQVLKPRQHLTGNRQV